MKIHINHETYYYYDKPTKRSIQLLRVTPQSFGGQKILSWQLTLPRYGVEVLDGFSNYCTMLSLHEPHEQLQFKACGEVEIDETLEYVDDYRLPSLLFLRDTLLTQCTKEIYHLAHKHLNHKKDLEALKDYSADILKIMPYTPGSTNVNTKAGDAFLMGAGVCQDHTHVFVAGARAMGIPARYVSGYLYTNSDQHLASHAWAEAYMNEHWYVFDVSNQIFTPSHHVQIAVGLDYNDAAPIRGVRVGGGHERMDYHVQVLSDQ